MKRKFDATILAASIGSILEWYDFLLYAYFATILAPLFFPAKDPFVSLLLTYSAFALGFLARPFGAFIIGRLGDVYGRRKALIFTICCMSIPTTLIGLLPTYATIGILAPIMIVLIRCLQGFAVSGEISSAASFLIEHAAKHRRGFAGGLIMSSAFFGILFGALVVTLFTLTISTETLHAGGWRIPFLLAGVFGLVGFALRLRTTESHQFQMAATKATHASLKTLFAENYLLIIKGVFITAIVAVGNYFLISYFNTYLENSGHFGLGQATLINSLSIVVFVPAIAWFGAVSDKFGRKRVFMWGCALLFLAAAPVFWLLMQHTFFTALVGQLLFVIILAMTDGVILTLLAEMFTTCVRNAGAALAYNISLAIFGGTAPLVALTLVHWAKHDVAPAIYLMAGAVISFVLVATLRETSNQPLS